METPPKLLRSGKCCHYRWAVVQGIGFTAFLERWWPELQDAYSYHLAGEVNRYASHTLGALPFQTIDESGALCFLHPELHVHSQEELDACGAIGINYYPGRRITSPLPPLNTISIPLLEAKGKEEFTMLPDIWKFVHAARYDLLIVAKPDDCILFTWYDTSSGNPMLFESMCMDEPFGFEDEDEEDDED